MKSTFLIIKPRLSLQATTLTVVPLSDLDLDESLFFCLFLQLLFFVNVKIKASSLTLTNFKYGLISLSI